MTDRELLELAAKAGGYSHYEYVENEYRDGRKVTGHYCSLLEVCVNPLDDDGDALRLAVKLGMCVDCVDGSMMVEFFVKDKIKHIGIEIYTDDPYAATRRAIVRAAAEIGKSVQSV